MSSFFVFYLLASGIYKIVSRNKGFLTALMLLVVLIVVRKPLQQGCMQLFTSWFPD